MNATEISCKSAGGGSAGTIFVASHAIFASDNSDPSQLLPGCQETLPGAAGATEIFPRAESFFFHNGMSGNRRYSNAPQPGITAPPK